MRTYKLSWALPGLAIAMLACAADSGPAQDCPVYPDPEPTPNNNSDEDDGANSTNNEEENTSAASNNNEEEEMMEETPPEEEPAPPEEEQYVPDGAEIAARLHGCTKPRYLTLGRMLQTRGVNLNSTGNRPGENAPFAGQLYRDAKDALGVPVFDSRLSEKDKHTTASALKLFDIFIQAAPEIITNIQNQPACQVGGQGHPMFDTNGSCVEESVSCLLGYPATADHMLLCNLIVEKADPANTTDVMKKQRIAVATLLSAAHTCE
jgi:hypothetical protein